MFPKPVKDDAQAVEVFLSCPWENDYVIEVDEAVCQIQLTEAVLHQPLKHGWCIAQTKRHAVALKEA